jgi:hypothetical protein
MYRLFEDIPFLRRFQQTQREETAKEEAAKKAVAEKPLIEDGPDAAVSADSQGEGIFGGIGEAAAREATRAKTSKVFKEVCPPVLHIALAVPGPFVLLFLAGAVKRTAIRLVC